MHSRIFLASVDILGSRGGRLGTDALLSLATSRYQETRCVYVYFFSDLFPKWFLQTWLCFLIWNKKYSFTLLSSFVALHVHCIKFFLLPHMRRLCSSCAVLTTAKHCSFNQAVGCNLAEKGDSCVDRVLWTIIFGKHSQTSALVWSK